MYQVYNKTSTEYAQNAPIVFQYYEIYRLPSNEHFWYNVFLFARPGATCSFNGVVAHASTSPFTVALYQNEVALPETTTT